MKIARLRLSNYSFLALSLGSTSQKGRPNIICFAHNFAGRSGRGHGAVGNQGGASRDVSQSFGAAGRRDRGLPFHQGIYFAEYGSI